MADRARKIKMQEIDGETIEILENQDPIEEAEEKEELQLRNAMAQFMGESGAKLYIYDMNEKSANGAGVFIEKLTLTDHDHDEILERLRDVYYGGDFKLQIRNKNGHIQMNQLVSVIKKEKPSPEEQKKDDIAAIISAVKDNNQNNSTEVFQLMMQQSQQQMQAMMQQSQQNIMMLMEALKNLKPEAPPQLTSKDMLAMLVSMKELNMNDAPAVDPMDNFIKGITMGKELGESGNDNTLTTAIKALAPSFTELSQRIQTPAATVAPATTAQSSTRPLSEADKMNLFKAQELLKKLQPLLVQCATAAQQQRAVDPYVPLFVDQLGVDVVKQYIGEDSSYEKLFQWQPELQQYRAWFDQLRLQLVQYVNYQDTPTETDHVPVALPESPLASLKMSVQNAPSTRVTGATDVSDTPVSNVESNTN